MQQTLRSLRFIHQDAPLHWVLQNIGFAQTKGNDFHHPELVQIIVNHLSSLGRLTISSAVDFVFDENHFRRETIQEDLRNIQEELVHDARQGIERGESAIVEDLRHFSILGYHDDVVAFIELNNQYPFLNK